VATGRKKFVVGDVGGLGVFFANASGKKGKKRGTRKRRETEERKEDWNSNGPSVYSTGSQKT